MLGGVEVVREQEGRELFSEGKEAAGGKLG